MNFVRKMNREGDAQFLYLHLVSLSMKAALCNLPVLRGKETGLCIVIQNCMGQPPRGIAKEEGKMKR